MSNSNKGNNTKEKPQKNTEDQIWLVKFFGAIFFIVKSLFYGLLISIFISIIIEWIGMAYFWEDNPGRSKQMFFNEYNAITEESRSKILNYEPLLVINYVITYAHEIIFESRLIDVFKQWFADPNSSGIGLFVKQVIVTSYNYIVAAGYIAMTLALRATIFILSLPFYCLCGFVGVIGGLVEREIRKDQGGIEHAYLYHLIRSHRYFFLNFFWVLYLSFPTEVRAEWFVLGGGLLFGATIYTMMWTFKKYL